MIPQAQAFKGLAAPCLLSCTQPPGHNVVQGMLLAATWDAGELTPHGGELLVGALAPRHAPEALLGHD